jgi:hypothetical protein
MAVAGRDAGRVRPTRRTAEAANSIGGHNGRGQQKYVADRIEAGAHTTGVREAISSTRSRPAGALQQTTEPMGTLSFAARNRGE